MNNINSQGNMPVLFVGHGNPMNAVEENEFSKAWKKLGEKLPRPKAILCISAHWETKGTKVTAMKEPMTIHDFGGFPKILFQTEYPAPGSPELASEIQQFIKTTTIESDMNWGLDHGCWSVLIRIYPEADIPVVQLSLDLNKSPEEHYNLGKELSSLRSKGILIIGSGNIVHNLAMADWAESERQFDWAKIANIKIKEFIINNDINKLINYKALDDKEIHLAVPTPEHYLPMLYSLSLKEENEKISFFNDKIVMGSLAMTSFVINSK